MHTRECCRANRAQRLVVRLYLHSQLSLVAPRNPSFRRMIKLLTPFTWFPATFILRHQERRMVQLINYVRIPGPRGGFLVFSADVLLQPSSIEACQPYMFKSKVQLDGVSWYFNKSGTTTIASSLFDWACDFTTSVSSLRVKVYTKQPDTHRTHHTIL